MPLSSVRPSHVKAWTSQLRGDGDLAASYVYALHARLAQIFADAVHDGIAPRSPCSRRHALAKTTLDTYGHLRPDRDESTRAAIEAVFSAHTDSVRTTSAGR
jgi:hypothetical protein